MAGGLGRKAEGGMSFDIRKQLVILSRIMTLDPGDVVQTGR